MNKKGFTLIELLVVIAILAILAGIVIIAVNPARQVAQARNAQRRADVLTILNGVHQYLIDNGNFPAGIVEETYYQLGTAGEGCNLDCGDDWLLEVDCLDLSGDLSPTYITAIPVDPLPLGTSEQTGYAIYREVVNDVITRITVRACLTEPPAEKVIEVTR